MVRFNDMVISPLVVYCTCIILKGWQDRVFAMERFYKGGRIYKDGMMKGKKALVSVTTGTELEAYQYGALHNGDMETILKPIQRGMFKFLGFSVLKPQISYAVAHLTGEERAKKLIEWEMRLKYIFEEKEISVGKY